VAGYDRSVENEHRRLPSSGDTSPGPYFRGGSREHNSSSFHAELGKFARARRETGTVARMAHVGHDFDPKMNAVQAMMPRHVCGASVRRVYNVARPSIASVPMRLADRDYGELPRLSEGRFPRDRVSGAQAN
jgi:hypothetical protein